MDNFSKGFISKSLFLFLLLKGILIFLKGLITLAPVSYLRSLVVRAVHRHRTGVGSIPAGGPYS